MHNGAPGQAESKFAAERDVVSTFAFTGGPRLAEAVKNFRHDVSIPFVDECCQLVGEAAEPPVRATLLGPVLLSLAHRQCLRVVTPSLGLALDMVPGSQTVRQFESALPEGAAAVAGHAWVLALINKERPFDAEAVGNYFVPLVPSVVLPIQCHCRWS